MKKIYQKLIDKEATLAVIGLGYVGLPIALEFAKKIKVIGFDINEDRIQLMQQKIDPSKELDSSTFDHSQIEFTSNIQDLKSVEFFIIAVPTPIDDANLPNLKPLLGASKTIAQVLKKGDYVVYESTVYPGCTEEDCIPILENETGLKFKDDFKVGYSPERINPGDKEHTLQNVIKVVSGCCDESLEEIAKVYELVVQAGVHCAPSIKVAEAAKKKFPFFAFPIKEDEAGQYLEMTHVADYSADGLPTRLFLTMLLNFGWRFDEVMALDKDQQMINVVRDKV